MHSRRRFGVLIVIAAALVAFTAAWLQFAPSALGGRASYLVISGTSMVPSFEQGDLVVVRSRSAYQVGDVVAYRNRLLGATIMHRIVDRAGEEYVLKGDNNAWLDEAQPSEADILGSPSMSIPGVGSYVRWLGRPLQAAVILGLASVVSVGGVFSVQKRRRHPAGSNHRRKEKRSGRQSPLVSHASELWIILAVAVAIPFAALSVLAFTRSTTKASFARVDYSQSGEFTYAAKVQPGAVYDRPLLASGEPIFRQLVNTVEVGFTYKFSAEEAHAVSGSGTLKLELSDKNGWRRTFNLQPRTAFSEDRFSLNGSFDMANIDRVLEDFEALTGVSRDVYTLSVVAELDVTGTVAGQPCCNAFASAPRLVFLRNPLQLLPTADGVQPAVSQAYLKSNLSGEVRVGQVEPNRLAVLGIGTGVGNARILGLAGTIAALICAAVLAYLLSRLSPEGESARIQRTYGHWLVAAEPAHAALPDRRFHLTSMSNLVRMAERLDTVILHFNAEEGAVHTYVVYDGTGAYTYEVSDRQTDTELEQADADDIAA